MGRLHLVILDDDKDFADSLSDALSSEYSYRFRTSCFTSREAYDEYILKGGSHADIILAGPSMYTEELVTGGLPVVILLTAGRTSKPISHLPSVNRYQRVNSLVSDILKVFTEKNDDQIFEAGAFSGTKIIGYFSASGGAGKTSLALACCVYWARAGQTVFYLNLESVPTTASVLTGSNENGLSQVLYHIKSGSANMHLKIESLRDISPEYGICFFQPPFSCMEIEEATGDDLVKLVKYIRESGQYAAVCIDMGPGIDSRSAALMPACDEVVILAAGQDIHSINRTNRFLSEIAFWGSGHGKEVAEKITIVLNKCSPDHSANLQVPSGCRGIFRIPVYEPGADGYRPDSMLDSETAGPAVRRICEVLLH